MSKEPIPGRCGSRKRRKRGTPKDAPFDYCESDKVMENGRCRLHGGKALRGLAHPSTTHGMSSKYKIIPAALQKHLMSSSLVDVASSREEIALVDARTSQLLEGIDERDPKRVAGSITRLHARLSVALKVSKETAPTVEQLRSMVDELGEAIASQASIAAAWDEVRANLDTRTKLTTAEIRYQQMLSDRIVVEQIEQFIRAMIVAARELFGDDRKKLNAFAERVMQHGTNVIGAAVGMNQTIDVKSRRVGGDEE